MTRRLMLGIALLALWPTGAMASEARRIADVPATDSPLDAIANVSADGQRVLVSAAGSTLSADAATGGATELPRAALRQSSQSPSGEYVVWNSSGTRCRTQLRVGRSDALAAARVVETPAAYARYGIDGITVADDGRVLARVGPCRDGSVGDPRAILSAAPDASRLEPVARARGSFADWPVSQSGRVFAICVPVRRSRSQWTSEVTVVDVRDGLKVRRARLSTNTTGLGPACVASDAGTATMMVIRRRKAPHKFTNVGVTVGGRGTPRFSLPGGTLEHGIGLDAVSPDGSQVVTRFDVDEATVINTRSGRYSRAFRPTDGGAGFVVFNGMPLMRWSPFAPALVITRSDGWALSFNPRTLRTTRLGRVVRGRFGGIRPCFLPSGRILLAATPRRSEALQELFVSDPGRRRVSRIDTSALGTVTSVSCEAAQSADAVVVATASGALYSVAASSIDGSPITVAP